MFKKDTVISFIFCGNDHFSHILTSIKKNAASKIWILHLHIPTMSHLIVFGVSTNQVVIWPNAKQFPEVTKGNRSVGLKAKVTVVMSRSQVTAFTENMRDRGGERERERVRRQKGFKTT